MEWTDFRTEAETGPQPQGSGFSFTLEIRAGVSRCLSPFVFPPHVLPFPLITGFLPVPPKATGYV